MTVSQDVLNGIKRGQVVRLDLRGAPSVMGKVNRPAVVVSPEKYNRALGVLTVVLVTSEKDYRKALLHEVQLPPNEGGLPLSSVAVPNQLYTVNSDTVMEVCGTVSPAILKEITEKLAVAVGITPIR